MAQQDRWHALDAVRAFALLLGIVLHATMSFAPSLTGAGWPIVDASQSTTLSVTFYVIHMFRMTTFFVMAGFFARLLFMRRGASGFWRDRSRRILVPLIVAWLLLTPVIVVTIVWSVSKLAVQPTPPTPPEGTLLAFPLSHLWFLYLLLVFYVVWLAGRKLVHALDRRERLRTGVDALLRRTIDWPVTPLVLAIPVAASLYFYAPWALWAGIPTPDYALVPNLPAFVAYGTAFGFGWVLRRQPDLLHAIARGWPVYFVAALVFTATCLWIVGPTGNAITADPTASLRGAYAVCYGIASWSWTFAITGAAMRFLTTESQAIRYLADSSYWLYLLHLPLVFALQVVVMQWPLHWSVKFPLILIVATSLLLLSYHSLVRFTYVGEVLNGRRYPKTRAEPAATPPVTPHAHLAVLRGVHKRFGTTVALDGLDLVIHPGELLAVLGPNGAGKTTAISLLLGLQQPDTGTVELFGQSPRALEARRHIGVMMQEVTLAPELEVRELVDLTASYYPTPLSVTEAFELTGTSALADRPYGKLSGGQKRQAQFAMALCGRPQLLFLDEPTVGLDLEARERMWATMRRLVQQGSAIVLTTHYLEEAETLADRVAVLAKGKVVACGSVAEMRAVISRRKVSCTTSLAVEHIRRWPEVDTVEHADSRVSITTARAEALVRRLLAADPELADLEVLRAGLSEAFIELTQEAA